MRWFRKPVSVRTNRFDSCTLRLRAHSLMDKTSGSGPEDWGFDSLWAHQMIRQFSAGGAVFKKEGEKTLWLLIQPARNDKSPKEIRWQLPKGLVGEGEKMEAAAVREVEEEGGVSVKVIGKVDSIRIIFSNTFEGKPEEKILKTIAFYLMEYLEEKANGHDEEVAEVVWLPFEEAKERLTFKNEKEILEKGKFILENPQLPEPQQSLF